MLCYDQCDQECRLLQNLILRGISKWLHRPRDRRYAKYELLCTERTLLTSDEAFNSILVRQDTAGIKGIFLIKKDLIAAAGRSIKLTLTKLAPRILPIYELVCIPPWHEFHGTNSLPNMVVGWDIKAATLAGMSVLALRMHEFSLRMRACLMIGRVNVCLNEYWRAIQTLSLP